MLSHIITHLTKVSPWQRLKPMRSVVSFPSTICPPAKLDAPKSARVGRWPADRPTKDRFRGDRRGIRENGQGDQSGTPEFFPRQV